MLLLLMCVVTSRNLHEITNAFQILQTRWETEGKIVLLSVLQPFAIFVFSLEGRKVLFMWDWDGPFFFFFFFYLLSQPFSLVSPNQWKIKNFFLLKPMKTNRVWKLKRTQLFSLTIYNYDGCLPQFLIQHIY